MTKTYKICVLEAQAYVHELVSSDVPALPNTISRTIDFIFNSDLFILVPCLQCGKYLIPLFL